MDKWLISSYISYANVCVCAMEAMVVKNKTEHKSHNKTTPFEFKANFSSSFLRHRVTLYTYTHSTRAFYILPMNPFSLLCQEPLQYPDKESLLLSPFLSLFNRKSTERGRLLLPYWVKGIPPRSNRSLGNHS